MPSTTPSTTPSAEIPTWVSITRVDDRHYQLTDISVESIGYCLGMFHSQQAAESMALQIAKSRIFKPVSSYIHQSALTGDASAIAELLGRRTSKASQSIDAAKSRQ